MNIRFSPEAARREMTPVDNLFFLEYMPDADGMFVKVYLYGLMQCYHPSLNDVDVADALGLSDAQVRCAFVYWQSKGLVRIRSDEPLTVEYLLTEQPAVTTATPMKYRRFIESLNALLSPRSPPSTPEGSPSRETPRRTASNSPSKPRRRGRRTGRPLPEARAASP